MQEFFRKCVATDKVNIGYALDDETAVHFVDGKLTKAIKSIDDKRVLEFEAGEMKVVDAQLL